MIKKQEISVVEVRILELEEKLMDLIELANNYPNIPVPFFEHEMDEIVSKIESLQRLNKN